MDPGSMQAMIRFGLGRRGDEPLPADRMAWLESQVTSPDAVLALPGATSAEGLAALREDRRTPAADGGQRRSRDLFRDGSAAYVDVLLTTDAPFRERLVAFWANHFTISLRRGEVAGVAHSFVREAIRPHVDGRFGDMLLAVMRHPAMLLYLDNAQSFGPDSPIGKRQQRGLNENMARECLELHTVTPAAGYTQADVTQFAAILTGWALNMQADGRWCTLRMEAEMIPASNCYAMARRKRTDFGRPAVSIRLRTAVPMAASVCWAAKPRARSRDPISAL